MAGIFPFGYRVDNNSSPPRILPTLSVAKVKEVNEMLSFSARAVQSSIDFENLVSARSLNECFGYQIPERKVTLDKR
jgi:hypothetical protein